MESETSAQEYGGYVLLLDHWGKPGTRPAYEEWKRQVGARRQEYLRALQRYVAFAPREESGAPPKSVDDSTMKALPVEHLDADRPVFFHTPGGGTWPTREAGTDVFEDDSSLERHASLVGGTKITLREAEKVAQQLVNGLTDIGARESGALRKDLVDVMRNRPHTLLPHLGKLDAKSAPGDAGAVRTPSRTSLGDGVLLTYTALDGTKKVLAVSAANHGAYSRYADPQEVKVKGGTNSTAKAGSAYVNPATVQFGGNFGMTSGPGFGGMGSVGGTLNFRQTAYTTTLSVKVTDKRAIGSSGPSHTYVNDVDFEVQPYAFREGGRLENAGAPVRLTVGSGFQWRVPDTLTEKQSRTPLKFPKTFTVRPGRHLDLAVADHLVVTPELTDWALQVGAIHARLEPVMPGMATLLEHFAAHTMHEKLMPALQGNVQVVQIHDSHNRVIGRFEYTVAIDRDVPLKLVRQVEGESKVQRNAAIGVDKTRSTTTQLTLNAAAGPSENSAFRAQAALTGTVSSGRTHALNVSDKAQTQYGLSNKSVLGLYEAQLVVKASFTPGYEMTGFTSRDVSWTGGHTTGQGTGAHGGGQGGLTTTLPAHALLRLSEHDARTLTGWDSNLRISQFDPTALARANQSGPSRFPEPPRPTGLESGHSPLLTTAHFASITESTLSTTAPTRRKSHMADQLARTLDRLRNKAAGQPRLKRARTEFNLPTGTGTVAASSTHSLPDLSVSGASSAPTPPSTPVEQTLRAPGGTSASTPTGMPFDLPVLPLDRNALVRDSVPRQPLPAKILKSVNDAVRGHDQARVRRLAVARSKKAQHVAYALRVGGHHLTNHRLAKAMGLKPKPPRFPSPNTAQLEVEGNQRRIHLYGYGMDTLLARLLEGRPHLVDGKWVHKSSGISFGFRHKGRLRHAEMLVTAHLEMVQSEYLGLVTGTATGGSLSSGRDFSTSTETQQGWQVGVSVDGGAKPVANSNLVMAGLTGSYGKTYAGKSETGWGMGTELGVSPDKRTHLYLYRGKLKFNATYRAGHAGGRAPSPASCSTWPRGR